VGFSRVSCLDPFVSGCRVLSGFVGFGTFGPRIRLFPYWIIKVRWLLARAWRWYSPGTRIFLLYTEILTTPYSTFVPNLIKSVGGDCDDYARFTRQPGPAGNDQVMP